MKQKTKTKRTLLDDRRIVLLFAFLLAIISWMIVGGYIMPATSTEITDVPVDYQKGAATYKNQNLEIVGEKRQGVRVTLLGNGSVILGLSSADIQVYPDYSVVNGPGEYNVPLKAAPLTGGSYEIEIVPKVIRLRFEKTNQKTFTLLASAPGIEAAEGFFKDDVKVNHTQINVSGPEKNLEEVAKVVAVVNDEMIREESFSFADVVVTLLDETGEPIDNSSGLLTITPPVVDITVPILKERVIPLTFQFTGAPIGFNTDWLRERLSLSADTIRVAGPASILDNITEIPVADIDVSMIEIGGTYPPYPISLSPELKNLDNLQNVTISVNTTGFEKKSFSVPISNVRVVNVPPGLTITPVEAALPQVTLMGLRSDINLLLPESIAIQIDASEVSANKGGQQSIVARIMIPRADTVFYVGSYQILCDVTVKQ